MLMKAERGSRMLVPLHDLRSKSLSLFNKSTHYDIVFVEVETILCFVTDSNECHNNIHIHSYTYIFLESRLLLFTQLHASSVINSKAVNIVADSIGLRFNVTRCLLRQIVVCELKLCQRNPLGITDVGRRRRA